MAEKEVKSGYKTTEFWLTAAANVAGMIMASGLAEDSISMKIAGLAVMVLSTLGYTYSRGEAKKNGA